MIILLFGPPGVGKGTQADLLCKAYGLKHISSGALLREEVIRETSLGKEVDCIMKAGNFPDDNVIMDLVDAQFLKLKEAHEFKGLVLDGVPRTLPQARMLDSLLAKNHLKIDALFILDAPEDFLIKRIEKRLICEGCGRSYHVDEVPPLANGICDECGVSLKTRADDVAGTVKNRIDLYKRQTSAVLAYYENSSFVHRINAIENVQDVFSSIKRLLCREKLDSCVESL